MIKSLKILNFQSHEQSELNFVDGVNVIVGRSDSGKSAIIRTIRWNRWNKPSGNSFRSSWGGETSVELETEEGSVLRIKDKKDKYIIRKFDDRETLFEAFGTNVPEEVASLLNLDEINLHLQLDSHFLLSKSSGQVAEHYNQVAKLDQIDKGRSNINKEIRSLKSNIEYQKQEVETKKTELKEFEYLDLFETDVEVLEDMEGALTALRSRYTKLQELLSSATKIKEQIIQTSRKVRMEPEVDHLLQLYKDKEKLEEEEMLLNKAVSTLNSITVSLQTNEAKHTRLLAEFKESFPNVCPLCGTKLKSK